MQIQNAEKQILKKFQTKKYLAEDLSLLILVLAQNSKVFLESRNKKHEILQQKISIRRFFFCQF